jgi:CDP-diglyceride synthetase
MNTESFFWLGLLTGTVWILCLGVAAVSALLVSVGIARDEGRERLALILAICGLVFPPVTWVFLIGKKRYRQAPWIGKFLLAGLVALVVTAALLWQFNAQLHQKNSTAHLAGQGQRATLAVANPP